MSEPYYAFKHHRKAELIKEVCKVKGLSRCEANSKTLRELSELLNQPYIALNMLPKPSTRRPLPVRKWCVPTENKVFIVMSAPFRKMYDGWEIKHGDVDDREEFYDHIQSEYDSCPKCPKWKWFQKFVRDHSDQPTVLFISPQKWQSVTSTFKVPDSMSVLKHPNARTGKKALNDFRDGKTKVLIVAMDDPPYEELPDCVWVHMTPDQTHRRYASEHYILNLIKAEEQQDVNSGDVSSLSKPSVDLFRMWEEAYTSS